MKKRSFILLPDSRIEKGTLYKEVATFIVTHPNRQQEFVEVLKINTPKLDNIHGIVKTILQNTLEQPLSPESLMLATKMGICNKLLYFFSNGGKVPKDVMEAFSSQNIDYPSKTLFYLPYNEDIWKYFLELSNVALSRKRT